MNNKVECPMHEGNFDCTPFCPMCEGEQEVSEGKMMEQKKHTVSNSLPTEYAQQVYDTDEVVEMMRELSKDGYSGLGLGLIVDLITYRLTPIGDLEFEDEESEQIYGDGYSQGVHDCLDSLRDLFGKQIEDSEMWRIFK